MDKGQEDRLLTRSVDIVPPMLASKMKYSLRCSGNILYDLPSQLFNLG